MKLPQSVRALSPLSPPAPLPSLCSCLPSYNVLQSHGFPSPVDYDGFYDSASTPVSSQKPRKPLIAISKQNRDLHPIPRENPDLLDWMLKRCVNSKDLVGGTIVHAACIKTGCTNVFFCNSLISMYAKCGGLQSAHRMFDGIPERNVVSWNTVISAYVEAGQAAESIELFNRMQQDDGLVPDQFTFGNILRGCTSFRNLDIGMQTHGMAIKSGVESNVFIASTLVDMYFKCQSIEDSWRVFCQTPIKNAVTWTSMITGFIQHGHKECALALFREMLDAGVEPVKFTFSTLVKVFDEPVMLKQARQAHGCMVKLGIEIDVLLWSDMITMYRKCESMEDVVKLSSRLRNKDLISWTALLVAYSQNGYRKDSLDIFREMIEDSTSIDRFALAAAIGACTGSEATELGRQLHAYAMRTGQMSDVSVGNAMITLYSKSGQICKAENLFFQMPCQDIISWTSLLTCYAQNGHGEEALLLFRDMLRKGLKPAMFCISSAVKACSSIASYSLGKQLHLSAVKSGFITEISVGNALVTMYAKCGSIYDAWRAFSYMPYKDIISWNAIIAGFSQHGFANEVLDLFHEMQQVGLPPDDFTFLSILVACSHSGLLAEGLSCFELMRDTYELEAKMEHYASMVDMFGRAGKLGHAMKFIKTMPYEPDLSVWEALLSSCKFHKNVELGKFAAEKMIYLKPEDPSAYVLLSSIHAELGMWDHKARLLRMMKDRGVKKEPSRSWVEDKGKIHVFSVEDKSHPQTHELYMKLEELKMKMIEAGYTPDINCVLHDIEQEQREYSVFHHSEKLAVAFALINIPEGSPIRIMKNLRVCRDCHTAMKLISHIENRQIILRDANRFHHFVDGACSCHDYW
ncbi:pentatricopeptide repeat-containing protein At3g24000, mitochondrial-like [Nymphaea colorata]|nr:pentatricopeptide repeat-containing protein At3g24000, mitochondrial-like [Nymphaea colorata]XP_049935265.1 pentatricopeptide repeat-containing protein At3g24000, mitochondrial-like [Nymphaea colorata]XP_049935266.1 pentatricopeptide repeat-containing protein At3g24000, mitochondrial-like [Nymphaea colorata]